jgi:hypothetical protein
VLLHDEKHANRVFYDSLHIAATPGAGVWPSGYCGGLARRRPGFESSAGKASIHLDVYPQRREHSWDGYVRYIKIII